MNLRFDSSGFKPNYGWVIVVVAALAMVATLPGRTHGLGMVTERLLVDDAFDLTRVSYSHLNFLGTILGGLFCLPCGWLIDRFGLRITLTTTVAALAAVVLWMTRLEGNGNLFVAILLTRGFGQSALSVISITMVGKWYRGRLTMPMAIYSLLLSLGFVGATQWAKPYATAEWRTVWGTMGWLLAGGMLPVAFLLTRDPVSTSPADDRAEQSGPAAATEGFTLLEAMRTPAFWIFGLAISVVALVGSGLSLFSESVLNQQGFPAEKYYDLLKLTGMIGILAQIPVGWLSRNIPLGWLQGVALLLKAICLTCLPFITSEAELTVYAIGMGVAGTTTTILFFAIWGQAFGRAHLGQIQSVSQMLTVLASALGPVVLAQCKEYTGSYAFAFHIVAGTLVVLGLSSFVVHVPRPEEAPRLRPLVEPELVPQPVASAPGE